MTANSNGDRMDKMERSLVAFSSKSSKEKALKEIISQLQEKNANPILMILISDYENHWYYAEELKKAYPEATIVGSTSSMIFSSEGTSTYGLSVLAINSGIECSAGLIFDIEYRPLLYIGHIKNALANLSSYENTCCLEFCTSKCNAEELVLDTIQEGLEGKEIPVFGSSSSAGPEGKEAIISLNGVIYTKTSVFVFIHNLEGQIKFCCENLYKPSEHCFKATDVDCDERVVYEFDNKPAADILAETLNVSLEELPSALIEHPLGRVVDGQIFITDLDKVMPDGSISCFSRIYNHTRMVLLNLDDIEKVWQETELMVHHLQEKSSFFFCINCSMRVQLFKKNKIYDEFISRMKKIGPFTGISGLGEQLQENHLNQVMILALFE